jgi:hypothetical protein
MARNTTLDPPNTSAVATVLPNSPARLDVLVNLFGRLAFPTGLIPFVIPLS